MILKVITEKANDKDRKKYLVNLKNVYSYIPLVFQFIMNELVMMQQIKYINFF